MSTAKDELLTIQFTKLKIIGRMQKGDHLPAIWQTSPGSYVLSAGNYHEWGGIPSQVPRSFNAYDVFTPVSEYRALLIQMWPQSVTFWF